MLDTNSQSISSTFYTRIFLYKSALHSFSLVHFGLVIFCQKDISKKARIKCCSPIGPSYFGVTFLGIRSVLSAAVHPMQMEEYYM